jgi:hypothetical protein
MVSLIYNVLIFLVQAASSNQAPPPPSQNRGPNYPIDDNIWVLLVVGILFGVYLIYKRNRSSINKAS